VGTTPLANAVGTVNVYTAGGLWQLRLNYERTTVCPALASPCVGGACWAAGLVATAVGTISSEGCLVIIAIIWARRTGWVQGVHSFWATVCKTVRPMLSDRCVSVLSVCDVGVLWPNGWTDRDETWLAGRPRPWPHCF